MRYHGLQPLRFFTAAAVLLCHASYLAHHRWNLDTPLAHGWQSPAFSFTVVLLFAVSGFVVTHNLQTTSAARFWLFRVVRIFPAFWLAAGLSLAIRWAQQQPLPAAGPLFQCLLLLPGTRPEAIAIGVEWTLIYELVFYTAFALFARLGGRRGVTAGTAVWLVACLAAQAARRTTQAQYPGWADVWLSGYNLAFLGGAAVYRLPQARPELRTWGLLALPPLLLLPLCGTKPATTLALQAAAAALIVWLAAGAAPRPDARTVRLGDTAYGVYLLHVPMLQLVFGLNERRLWFAPSDALVLFAAGTALFVGAAYGHLEWAAYRWLRRRLDPRRPALAELPPARAA